MRFLILGCNGMAGNTIALYLKEQGHYVIGFDKKESRYVTSIVGDARDADFVKRLVLSDNFDTVINCIGILNQFADQNKALATYLNAYFPHFLADILKDTDIQIIQMSTDCVFSGKRGAYSEDDFRDGESFYDRSKALGELEDNKNVTLRNSIIGPDINPNGIGLFNWFMQQRGPINGYTKAMWTGQTTLQLAKTMEQAALQRIHGLYNMVPAISISKFELLCLFNQYLRNGRLDIVPVEGVNLDKSLRRTRFNFSYLIPSYECMIVELTDWLRQHKDLFPHYGL